MGRDGRASGPRPPWGGQPPSASACPVSHLPPEGGIDGEQGEQRHAGHGTADHQGDRGGACQLQGLGKRSRRCTGAPGEAAAGVPSLPTHPPLHVQPRLGAAPSSHSGVGRSSLLYPRVPRADPVTHTGVYLCSVAHASQPHTQLPPPHTPRRVIPVSTTPATPMCHATSAPAQMHTRDHPGLCQRRCRWALATWECPLLPAPQAQARPSCSPGPWAAGPARQRWTGADTGSGCGLPGSPESGSSRCPSPLHWHLLGEGIGGVTPSPTPWPHSQRRPLPTDE